MLDMKKIQINQIRINAADSNIDDIVYLKEKLLAKCAKVISAKQGDIKDIVIVKKSLDARKKTQIFYTFSVVISVENADYYLNRARQSNVTEYVEKTFKINIPDVKKISRPVIVGFGPAGIAAAYVFTKCGLSPLIIERGSAVEERQKKVEIFWNSGKLDESSNAQFGEGGAGAFSDGKLNTGNKDKYGIQKKILETLVFHGARSEILYESKPHLGTDALINIVKNIREHLKDLGAEFLFDTKLEEIIFEKKSFGMEVSKLKLSSNGKEFVIDTNCVVLAIGHSARDTFKMLKENAVKLEQKPFAIGYRVAHPQGIINSSQYGESFRKEKLPAADYKLTTKTKSGRAAYSFCMCPGGYIVDASSEEKALCVNGMSYSKRNGDYANSAIVIGVGPEDISGLLSEIGERTTQNTDPLLGMRLQVALEKRAYNIGDGHIPVCTMGGADLDIKKEKAFRGNIKFVPNLIRENLVLPPSLNEDFLYAMNNFGKIIKGFDEKETIIAAVESRTSSPVRIVRDKDYEAIGIRGLYPAGEGAGYAGGIMSAAMDGIKIAASIIEREK